MLNLSAYGAFGFYNNAVTQNYQNFGVSADGRFDIQRDWYLTAGGGFARTTEALGTPDVAFAQSPTVVNTLPVNLAMYQRFNRLFYQLSAGLTRFSYQDFSTPSTSPFLQAVETARNTARTCAPATRSAMAGIFGHRVV